MRNGETEAHEQAMVDQKLNNSRIRCKSLFNTGFAGRYGRMAEICERESESPLEVCPENQEVLIFPTEENTEEELRASREDSATGNDNLLARILNKCSTVLAKPLTMLIIRIISTMAWPDCWRDHLIIPIFKKAALFLAKNYCGTHVTTQLSKVVERVIKNMIMPRSSLNSAACDVLQTSPITYLSLSNTEFMSWHSVDYLCGFIVSICVCPKRE